MKIALGLPLLFVFLLGADRVRAETINIVVTPDLFKGGLGDFASCLLMAQELHAGLPKAHFRILLPSREHGEKIAALVPELKVGEISQILGGIEFYQVSEGVPLPKAQVVLSFSDDQPRSHPLFETAPVALRFEEPLGPYGSPEFDERRLLPLRPVERRERDLAAPNRQFRVNTGLGLTESGIYLSTHPRPAPHSRAKLLDMLDTIPCRLWGEPQSKPRNTVLAFAYVHQKETQTEYLEALRKLALTKPYKGKHLLVVVQKELPAKFEVPPNMEIRVYSKLPFDVTRSLYDHCDLPPYTTGSVSLSLALDSGKVPFYEVLDHKQPLSKSLVAEILVLNPTLSQFKKELGILLRRAYVLSLGRLNTADEIFSVLKNERFLKEAEAAVKQMRSRESLAAVLVDLLPQLATHPEDFDEGKLNRIFRTVRGYSADPPAKECGFRVLKGRGLN